MQELLNLEQEKHDCEKSIETRDNERRCGIYYALALKLGKGAWCRRRKLRLPASFFIRCGLKHERKSTISETRDLFFSIKQAFMDIDMCSLFQPV